MVTSKYLMNDSGVLCIGVHPEVVVEVEEEEKEEEEEGGGEGREGGG